MKTVSEKAQLNTVFRSRDCEVSSPSGYIYITAQGTLPKKGDRALREYKGICHKARFPRNKTVAMVVSDGTPILFSVFRMQNVKAIHVY